jgi:manganese/iron transport system permease protein
MGLPVFWLDLVLLLLVSLTIVISIGAVGNILVLALLITPAACARLLTDRLGAMMILAPAIGLLSCVAGLYLSYTFNLAAGGLIVLVVTGLFLVSWLLAPKHGLIRRTRRRGPGARSPEPVGAGAG